MDDNHISCVHDAALNDGEWILPSGDPCNSITSPIQCNDVTASGPTNITLQRIASFRRSMELVYKCCLPNDCDNGFTDSIIAYIYCKLNSVMIWLSFTDYYLHVASIYIIENTFDPRAPSDITAIPQSYTVHCVIVGGGLTEFHYYYQDITNGDIDLDSTHCSSQYVGYYCTLATDNTVTTDVSPDDVIDKTITVTWKAEEISSGAFRQDNGDHVIECNARGGSTTRTSTVTIEGILFILFCQVMNIYSSIIISN